MIRVPGRGGALDGGSTQALRGAAAAGHTYYTLPVSDPQEPERTSELDQNADSESKLERAQKPHGASHRRNDPMSSSLCPLPQLPAARYYCQWLAHGG